MSQRRSQRLASQSSEQLIRQSSQVSESTQKSSRKKKEDSPKNLDLTGERLNICLLLLLYTLQGVPMGLSSTVAFSLTEKGASFADQGVFSLASWPFSLKILLESGSRGLHYRGKLYFKYFKCILKKQSFFKKHT